MKANRIDPKARNLHAGMHTLPSGRRVFITQSGLQIGCRYVSPPADHGISADRVQEIILRRGRPLSWDQAFVTAMCTSERRP